MTSDGDLSRWVDVEAIKKLKAHYFRFMDYKLWDQWGDLFTENATVHVQHGDYTGRQNIVAAVSNRVKGARTVHHGHMPEIELTGPTTAHGMWAMFDIVDRRSEDGFGFYKQGYGHYEEDYVKEGDTWRIATMRITRLRQDQYEVRPDTPIKELTFFGADNPTNV